MAETLLNILAKELVGRALSLAADRLSRLWGVKEDLEALAKSVTMIQSMLSDAEGKCTTNTVRIWLTRLQTVSFDAGNLLDEFAYEVQRKKFEKPMPDEFDIAYQYAVKRFALNQMERIKAKELHLSYIVMISGYG